jgi:hypothetical protein
LLQYVEEHTSKVLKYDNFVDVSPAILETLVKRDNLSCTEDELFQACMKWAKHEADRKNVDPEPKILRDILKPILPHIRFLVFDTKTFSDGPAKLGLLTKSEIESVVNSKILDQMPPTICKFQTLRKFKKPAYFYVFGEPETACSNCINKKGSSLSNLPNFTYSEYASNDFENTKTIVGFKIPSQIKTGKISKKNESYLENFTVYFYEHEKAKDWYGHPYGSETEEADIQEINFNSVVKYNSNIVVNFEPDAFQSELASYGYGIVFHKSGCYPTKPNLKNESGNTLTSCSDDEAKDEFPCGFMTILCE